MFTPEEESLGGPNVVILSHELWATQFGSDPAVVGRALSLSGAPYDVVGVMPPGLGEQDFWVLFVPLVAVIIWMGVAPGPVLRRMEPAAAQYVELARPSSGGFAASPATVEVRP